MLCMNNFAKLPNVLLVNEYNMKIMAKKNRCCASFSPSVIPAVKNGYMQKITALESSHMV